MNDNIIWDVFCNNGSRCNNRAIANRHAGIEDRLVANLDAITNSHWFPVLWSFDALARSKRMGRCIDVDARCELAVPPDIDPTDVQDNAIEIGVEVPIDVDIVPIVTAERWFYCTFLAKRAEKLRQEFPSFGLVVYRRVIVATHEVTCAFSFSYEFGVIGVIQLPLQHLLFFTCQEYRYWAIRVYSLHAPHWLLPALELLISVTTEVGGGTEHKSTDLLPSGGIHNTLEPREIVFR